MSYCLCCCSSLLQHVHRGNLYWYCPNCRQEMPEAKARVSGDSPLGDHQKHDDPWAKVVFSRVEATA